MVDLRMAAVLGFHVRDRLAQTHLAAEDDLVRALHPRLRVLVEVRAGQAHRVDADDLRAVALHGDVGRHVLRDHRAAADERQAPDAGELVHGRQAAEDHVVFHHHVAGEGDGVGEDAAVVELDVVRYVALRHQEASVRDPRHASASGGADVHGRELADPVGVADHQTGRLSCVLEVLRNGADGGELEDDVLLADGRVTLDYRVRAHPRARADLHLGSDHRVGADLDAGVELGVPVHDRRRMDGQRQSFLSAIIAIICASLAGWPSTFASPARRQIAPFCRSMRT